MKYSIFTEGVMGDGVRRGMIYERGMLQLLESFKHFERIIRFTQGFVNA